MRVLQITASLKIGGAERVAKDIGMAAINAGHEVHYLVFRNEIGEYEEELVTRGAMIFHVPSPSSGYVAFISALRKLMLNYNYDVIHAHTMFNTGWVMWTAKVCHIPVRIAHAHSALRDGSRLIKNIYEIVMRWMILQNATDLVACGDAAGIRLFGEKAYKKRGIRILNGIDVNAYTFNQETRQKVRKELNVEKAFVIGHVGHLAEVKNQSFILRLLPVILQYKPNAKLLMLGEGEDRQMLEQIIHNLKLTAKVIMKGNVRNVEDYLCAMDVFVLPSIYEGMPLSVLEAQANGLPCILSTEVPKDVQLTELVQYVSLDKPQFWIDSICSAERKECRYFAEELIAKGCDANTAANSILKLYERELVN